MEITDQLALELIDQITGDDFCEDLDCRLHLPSEDGPRSWQIDPKSELGIAAEKLLQIYTIAHSMVKSNICYGAHDKWRLDAGLMAESTLPAIKQTELPISIKGE